MRFPGLSSILKNGVADTSKIGMSQFGIWNALMSFIGVPPTLTGKVLAIASLSIGGAFLKHNLPSDSIIADVASDAAQELGNRMLDHSPTIAPSRGPSFIEQLTIGLEQFAKRPK